MSAEGTEPGKRDIPVFWYIDTADGSRGPFDEGQMLAFIRTGQLGWHARVGRQGASEWLPITTHPPFAAALGPPDGGAGPLGAGMPARAGVPSGAVASGNKALRPRGRGTIVASIAGGCAGVLLLSACCLCGWAFWPPSEPTLEIISAEVIPGPADSTDDTLRVRVRSEPGVLVEVGFEDVSLPIYTGDSGEGAVSLPLNTLYGPSLDVTVRVSESGDHLAAQTSTSVTRTPRLVPIRGGHMCSFGGCQAVYRLNSLAVTAPDGGSLSIAGALGGSEPTAAILARANPADAFAGRGTMTLPVEYRFADGTVLTESLTVPAGAVRRVLSHHFGGAARGPVSVPREGNANALYWHTGARLFGAATHAGDVGRVAFNRASQRDRQCGSYSGPTGVRRLFVRQEIITVEVRERRSGTVVDSRIFQAARPSCPRTVQVEPGVGDIFWSRTEVERSSIEAWLTSRSR